MFETLKRLYSEDKISIVKLKVAVSPKEWITADQYKEIVGEDYIV